MTTPDLQAALVATVRKLWGDEYADQYATRLAAGDLYPDSVPYDGPEPTEEYLSDRDADRAAGYHYPSGRP